VYASTDIWTAARRGDVDLLRILIEEEKNDVNEGDEDGSTPLHWAAYFDRYLQLSLSAAQLACVSLTFSLALGSSLSLTPTQAGGDQLPTAARRQHRRAQHEGVADAPALGLHRQEPEGEEMLFVSCIVSSKTDSTSSQSMLLLIQEGADISKSDKRGYDCLTHACQYGNVLMAHNLIVKQGKGNPSIYLSVWPD
jgi:ankyrin repeat protein